MRSKEDVYAENERLRAALYEIVGVGLKATSGELSFALADVLGEQVQRENVVSKLVTIQKRFLVLVEDFFSVTKIATEALDERDER